MTLTFELLLKINEEQLNMAYCELQMFQGHLCVTNKHILVWIWACFGVEMVLARFLIVHVLHMVHQQLKLMFDC